MAPLEGRDLESAPYGLSREVFASIPDKDHLGGPSNRSPFGVRLRDKP